MPSSSSAATRPPMDTLPCVGNVVPVIILSSVLLPAPLMPMMPSALPGSTVKLTSRSTHLSWCCAGTNGISHSASRAQRLRYCL